MKFIKRLISAFIVAQITIISMVSPAWCAESTTQDNKDISSLKSVACIFAGREKYLSILMPYLKKLQETGKLTEINLWQFTNNSSDVAYLSSIANLHKTSKNFTEYRAITPVVKNNEFSLKIKAKNDAHILINDKYEFVLGGWGNTKSVIRHGIQGRNLCEVSRRVLNERNHQNFNISLKNKILTIENLMSAKVDIDEIKSIKIHTGFGSEGFWDYEETQNKNIKLFDTEKRVVWHNWGECYKYYLDYDFDVFLKIDDDIVYMDLDRYDEFIKYIVNNPQKNCVFPNMVNHGTSLFYNNKYGLIPTDILIEPYKSMKSSPQAKYKTDTWGCGSIALILHKYFLNNVEKFKRNDISPINVDKHQVRICMFGISKKITIIYLVFILALIQQKIEKK